MPRSAQRRCFCPSRTFWLFVAGVAILCVWNFRSTRQWDAILSDMSVLQQLQQPQQHHERPLQGPPKQEQQPPQQLLSQKPRPLSVAFVVFITNIGGQSFEDALAVLAYGFKQCASRSQNKLTLLALVPLGFPEDQEQILKSFGYVAVLRRPRPVEPASVQSNMAREHLERIQGHGQGNTFSMADELLKYWGMAMTEYDRVLVIDADVVILQPMDEIMGLEEDFLGVYDHGLDGPSSTMPPAQGGWLLFRPRQADYDQVVNITIQGRWSGRGWEQSQIGYCYGGVGPDGLLQYYFNKDALPKYFQLAHESRDQGHAKSTLLRHSNLPEGTHVARVSSKARWRALDRKVYDIVLNERLRADLAAELRANRTQRDLLEAATSVHFTGDCPKPWRCGNTREWFCEGLTQKWWELYTGLAEERGAPTTLRSMNCQRGVYRPLPRIR